jgi:hypothetical protein
MDLTNVSSGPLAPNERTPEVRSVVTTQEAPSETDAVDGAWRVWDAKYGPGSRPAEECARVQIRPL